MIKFTPTRKAISKRQMRTLRPSMEARFQGVYKEPFVGLALKSWAAPGMLATVAKLGMRKECFGLKQALEPVDETVSEQKKTDKV